MKNYYIVKIVAVVFIAALLFSSCAGYKKMQKDYGKVKFKATPEVLQTKGGKIAVSISGSIPEKYFSKKAKMVISPVLKYEGGSTPLTAITLRGEKTEGEGTVINATGGSFANSYTIDYLPAMLESKLVANAQIIYKKKTIDLPEVKLADGVIITEKRIDNTNTDLQLAEHGYEKATTLTKVSGLYFPYGLYNWDKNLKINKVKENIDKLKDMEDFTFKGWEIQSININAWASPEGEEAYNENLSKDRANTGQKYLKDMFATVAKEKAKLEIQKAKKEKRKLVKADKDKKAPEYVFNVSAKGEDKDGFVAAVKASNMNDKNAIINVIESQVTKAEREKKIKDMTVIYSEIESLLEPLRRSEMSISFLEPKKTDEQIALLSTSRPDSLDIKELLYAATLTKDLNTKLKIYKSTISLHPDSWKAYNNAGYVEFKLGNYDEAGTDFEKANTLDQNNGIVLNNLGAIALAKNNFEAAKSYYESAKQKGVNTDYNFGIVLITQGNYEQAMSNFESRKCDYNLALAQLLLDNLTGAQSTLECAGKNAEIYYLMAVIGARTQNAQMMNDNLKKAIEADPKYRKQAKSDREFIKFFENADFKEITKF